MQFPCRVLCSLKNSAKVFMTNDKRFYTYAYLRVDGTPYYIGKGCGRRAYKKHGRLPVPPKNRILILKKNLTQQEALRHEVYMVAIFGRKDLSTGCLLNMTNGGDGTSSRVWTPEQREHLSKKHKGKKINIATRRKMSKAKLGAVVTEETREKMSEAGRGRTQHPEWAEQSRQRCRTHNEKCRGASWWVQESGKTTLAHECPGEEWQRGRVWKKV